MLRSGFPFKLSKINFALVGVLFNLSQAHALTLTTELSNQKMEIATKHAQASEVEANVSSPEAIDDNAERMVVTLTAELPPDSANADVKPDLGLPEDSSVKENTLLLATNPNDVGALERRAFALRGLGRYTESLGDYQHLLILDKNSKPGLEGTVIVLRAMGAAQLARQYAGQRPDLYTKADLANMDLQIASALTRMGSTDKQLGTDAYIMTNAALERFKELIESPYSLTDVLLEDAATFDLIVAESNKHNFSRVSVLYEDLVKHKREIPDYVTITVAEAYGSLKKSDVALSLLTPLASKYKDNADFVRGYFYVLSDNDQQATAQKFVDEALIRTPLYRYNDSPRLRIENPDYVQLLTLAAWCRAFDDRLAEADTRFKEAIHVAPNNSSLRDGRATVHLWEGYPRLAREEFLRALATNPTSLDLRRGLVAVSFARGDEKGGKAALDALLQEAPDSDQLLKLADDQVLRLKPSLTLSFENDRASDTSAIASKESLFHLHFDSAAFGGGAWRVFIDNLEQNSQIDSQQAQVKVLQGQSGLGLQYQQEDVSGSLALVAARDGQTGLTGNTKISPYDGFTLMLNGETLTTDIPAKAAEHDISGEKVSAETDWQPFVSTAFSASGSETKLTDGNHIENMNLSWKETWAQTAHFKLWSKAYLSEMAASKQTVPYFSPKQDDVTAVVWGYSWLYSRTSWENKAIWNNVELETGTTDEKGYPSLFSGGVTYRLDWQFSKRLTSEFSISRTRRDYDGQPEWENAFQFSITEGL